MDGWMGGWMGGWKDGEYEFWGIKGGLVWLAHNLLMDEIKSRVSLFSAFILTISFPPEPQILSPHSLISHIIPDEGCDDVDDAHAVAAIRFLFSKWKCLRCTNFWLELMSWRQRWWRRWWWRWRWWWWRWRWRWWRWRRRRPRSSLMRLSVCREPGRIDGAVKTPINDRLPQSWGP